jgi:N-methylhydantoinase B
MNKNNTATDIILTQVIGNRLGSIAREMSYALIRSARSILVHENEDCSAAILDSQCQIVAQDVHCAGHLGSIALAVKECIQAIGPDNLEPGDVLAQNDPYRGCIHLPDLTMVSPVFYDGKIVLYVANIAHHSDIGGMAPGSSAGDARELFQEGTIFPPLKLVSAGMPNKAVIDIFSVNTRVPRERFGDLHAQISAQKIGVDRATELLQKYGRGVIEKGIEALLEHSEYLTRAEIKKFPEGKYYFEEFLDDDGISRNPLKIAVTVTVEGDELVYDFSQSDHQAEGAMNSPLSVTLATVYYITRALTDWRIPVNQGCYRPIQLIAPRGLVTNPSPPAAVALCSEVYPRIIDVLLGAFAQCIPNRVVAAPMGTNNVHILGGLNPRTGAPFIYYECYGGGWGGGLGYDGISGYDCFETNAKSTPVEVLETYYPFRLIETKFIKDSGGAGKFRGGNGVLRRLEILADSRFSLLADRFNFPPFGLLGGKPGSPGNVMIRKPNGDETFVYSKVSNVELHAGDQIITKTGGGGGYGNPLERDPELISKDLKWGRVSLEKAEREYGVVIDPTTFEVSKNPTSKPKKHHVKGGKNG